MRYKTFADCYGCLLSSVGMCDGILRRNRFWFDDTCNHVDLYNNRGFSQYLDYEIVNFVTINDTEINIE